MSVIWRFIGGAILMLAGAGSYSIVSMALDGDPPIAYEDVRALTPSVEQGGTIDVQFTVFRQRVCPVVVKRWLTDAAGERHSVPQYTVGLQQLAGRVTYRRSITIPTATALGAARYEVSLDYTCNPLQRLLGPINVTSPPVRFAITPAAGDLGHD